MEVLVVHIHIHAKATDLPFPLPAMGLPAHAASPELLASLGCSSQESFLPIDQEEPWLFFSARETLADPIDPKSSLNFRQA